MGRTVISTTTGGWKMAWTDEINTDFDLIGTLPPIINILLILKLKLLMFLTGIVNLNQEWKNNSFLLDNIIVTSIYKKIYMFIYEWWGSFWRIKRKGNK